MRQEEEDTKEPKHPEFDQRFTEAKAFDYVFVVMQGVRAALSGLKVYQSMMSSYYWFDFGYALSNLVTAVWNIVVIIMDWEAFVYGRKLLRMMIWRMLDDMGVAPPLEEEEEE